MGELPQLTLNSKVKMKLIQPDIICDGRKRITGHFRGKVIQQIDSMVNIRFKYKGEFVEALYSLKRSSFLNVDYKDIKITSVGVPSG